MLEPVVVTEYGARLTGSPHNVLEEEGFRDDTDADLIVVSEHEGCIGFVRRYSASRTHDKLRCSECELAVYIDKKVKTYGDLRQYFMEFNSPSEPIWLERMILALLKFVRKIRQRSRSLSMVSDEEILIVRNTSMPRRHQSFMLLTSSGIQESNR